MPGDTRTRAYSCPLLSTHSTYLLSSSLIQNLFFLSSFPHLDRVMITHCFLFLVDSCCGFSFSIALKYLSLYLEFLSPLPSCFCRSKSLLHLLHLFYSTSHSFYFLSRVIIVVFCPLLPKCSQFFPFRFFHNITWCFT